MAQQIEPVKRHVAVKLIRSGMDSKTVVGRFEAERQALSMMRAADPGEITGTIGQIEQSRYQRLRQRLSDHLRP